MELTQTMDALIERNPKLRGGRPIDATTSLRPNQ